MKKLILAIILIATANLSAQKIVKSSDKSTRVTTTVTNYTPANNTPSGHFQGIDSALFLKQSINNAFTLSNNTGGILNMESSVNLNNLSKSGAYITNSASNLPPLSLTSNHIIMNYQSLAGSHTTFLTNYGSGDFYLGYGSETKVSSWKKIVDTDYLNTLLSSKANLSSPTFTGTPIAPTAPVGTNTTQLATTAFVQNAVSAGGTLPYKVYTALISQTGTNDPSATIMQNTLGGTIIWTRDSAGIYSGTLTGVFTANKTTVSYTNGGIITNLPLVGASRNSGGDISIVTKNPLTGNFEDGYMQTATIEIRVYN